MFHPARNFFRSTSSFSSLRSGRRKSSRPCARSETAACYFFFLISSFFCFLFFVYFLIISGNSVPLELNHRKMAAICQAVGLGTRLKNGQHFRFLWCNLSRLRLPSTGTFHCLDRLLRQHFNSSIKERNKSSNSTLELLNEPNRFISSYFRVEYEVGN